MTDLLEYLNKLSPQSLKVAPRRRDTKPFPLGGNAIYKPALLLVVFQLIQKGNKGFSQGSIDYPTCRDNFYIVLQAVSGGSAIDGLDAKAVQPFWYLGAGKPRIWTFIPQDGMTLHLKELIANGTQIKTRPKLEKVVSRATIDPNDLELFRNNVANAALRSYLIATYFPSVETRVISALDALVP